VNCCAIVLNNILSKIVWPQKRKFVHLPEKEKNCLHFDAESVIKKVNDEHFGTITGIFNSSGPWEIMKQLQSE